MLSTHDVDLAHRWADEVAVAVGGRVVAGDASTILGDAALLRTARPRTAAELHALPGGPVAHDTVAGTGSTGSVGTWVAPWRTAVEWPGSRGHRWSSGAAGEGA